MNDKLKEIELKLLKMNGNRESIQLMETEHLPKMLEISLDHEEYGITLLVREEMRNRLN